MAAPLVAGGRTGVVVIGSLNYDILCRVAALPARGETLAADEAVFRAGGKGANQAVQCARLGLPTQMAGCVGDDPFGVFMRQSMRENGVGTDFLKTTAPPTGLGMVNTLPDGGVHATIVRGANSLVTPQYIDALRPLLRETALVILQLEMPVPVVEYAGRTAVECGCDVLFNAAPAAQVGDAFLRDCGVVVVNEVEASFYAGRPVDSPQSAEAEILPLCRAYGNQWVFTLGRYGAVLCDGEEVRRLPALDMPVAETTGAGDSFVGGLAYGLCWGRGLMDAALLANCCSGITIGKTGAQEAMPTLDRVLALRETQYDIPRHC